METRTGWGRNRWSGRLCLLYLGSNIRKDGGSDQVIQNIQLWIGKARTAFTILRLVWKSQTISRKTKVCMFNSNEKSVLLYGSEQGFQIYPAPGTGHQLLCAGSFRIPIHNSDSPMKSWSDLFEEINKHKQLKKYGYYMYLSKFKARAFFWRKVCTCA